MRRSSPLARAEVALYAPDRAAVMLHPADGRWPEHERLDRVALAVGMAAQAAHHSPDTRWAAFRGLLIGVARDLAAHVTGTLPGGMAPLHDLGVPAVLAVIPWEGRGRACTELELVGSTAGVVPRLVDSVLDHGPTKEICALALAIGLAAEVGRPARLDLAFGIESLVAWLSQADRRLPARNALAYALNHADQRLVENDLEPLQAS